jgi:hypothetical protein
VERESRHSFPLRAASRRPYLAAKQKQESKTAMAVSMARFQQLFHCGRGEQFERAATVGLGP